jgi:hypothetical protein
MNLDRKALIDNLTEGQRLTSAVFLIAPYPNL